MGFDFRNSKDKAFFEGILKEQIEIYGMDLEYWTVAFNENKDKLYNEDTLPTITAKYDIKGYGQPITELFTLNKFGFQSPDVIELFVSKKAFHDIAGDVDPKNGDYVYIKYMERVFVVSDVKHEETVFLQDKFSYKLVLNAADNTGVTKTTEESTALSTFTSAGMDGFDDNAFIEAEDDKVVVIKSGDESPFGAWE